MEKIVGYTKMERNIEIIFCFDYDPFMDRDYKVKEKFNNFAIDSKYKWFNNKKYSFENNILTEKIMNIIEKHLLAVSRV